VHAVGHLAVVDRPTLISARPQHVGLCQTAFREALLTGFKL
jgi:hypothetical protein